MTSKTTRLKFDLIKLLLLGSIVLGIVLRIINLGTRELWYDEVISLHIASGQLSHYLNPTDKPIILSNYSSLLHIPEEANLRETLQTFIDFLKSLLGGEPHPVLFFLTQMCWIRLFGYSEIASRSIGCLFSIGTIFTGYFLGKNLLGNKGGLLLAALLALNPFYLFHSLNLRMYAPAVFWSCLSTLSMLKVINHQPEDKKIKLIFWSMLLILSIAGGFLTVYLFAYFILALGILVLYLDRKRWLAHGLKILGGVILTIPWVLWGAIKQFKNADINRFASKKGFLATGLQHIQDVSEVLSVNLIIGDWSTSIEKILIYIVGFVVIGILAYGSWKLWKNQENKLLITALIVGVLPLLIGLCLDIVTHKFTIAFGFGRAMIFILPGLLLIVTVLIEKITGKWKNFIISGLLILYLFINLTDLNLRQRNMMQNIAQVVKQEPNRPTLIALTSRARGHILRLAYYIDPSNTVAILAQPAPKLIPALANEAVLYPRIIVLDSERPTFFDPPATEAEKQKIRDILQQYQLVSTKKLIGTMDLDNFVMSVYQRNLK